LPGPDLPAALEGVLVIDKPSGLTSSGVVQRVRRLLHIDKVGHTGTLDPMATGVLPLCLGQATALAQILTGQDKRYSATLRLGAATDSGDADGKVTQERPVPPLARATVEAELELLVGAQLQMPPMVSAVQVGGKRLYELARQGISVEREPRAITVLSLKLLDWASPDLSFEVRCSKGTYVRVLAEDLAAKLGTVGHLVALRRVSSGRFEIEQARTLAELERSPESAAAALITMEEAIAEMPRAVLTEAEARALAYGKRPERAFEGPPGWTALVAATGKLLALAERGAGGSLSLKRVFVRPVAPASSK
jgi:tRNA pseudouridine55 synthase